MEGNSDKRMVTVLDLLSLLPGIVTDQVILPLIPRLSYNTSDGSKNQSSSHVKSMKTEEPTLYGKGSSTSTLMVQRNLVVMLISKCLVTFLYATCPVGCCLSLPIFWLSWPIWSHMYHERVQF